ncbi:hypothetical protein LCGC14_2648240, partial [marine sediment metagenome]
MPKNDTDTSTQGVMTAMGVPGLSVWKGILGEEYLQALSGTKAVKIFIEMGDDAVIGALLDAMIMPLIAAEMFVDSADESNEADNEAADFVDSCMNDMTRYSWREHTVEQLS